MLQTNVVMLRGRHAVSLVASTLTEQASIKRNENHNREGRRYLRVDQHQGYLRNVINNCDLHDRLNQKNHTIYLQGSWVSRWLPLLLWSTQCRSIPTKVWPNNSDNYDGKREPTQRLKCYSIAINLTGGDNDVKSIYLPMVLEPMPLTWFE